MLGYSLRFKLYYLAFPLVFAAAPVWAQEPVTHEPQPVQIVVLPSSQPDPYVDLDQQPARIRPIKGQSPPPGYVEVEMPRKGLIWGGGVLFGVTYLGCLLFSPLNHNLSIPIAGPAIASFDYEADPDDYLDEDEYSQDPEWEQEQAESRAKSDEFAIRTLGILGSVAQGMGVAMFIAGLAWKKKLWLRQDLAGVQLQVVPTMVGRHGSGIGLVGTF